MIEALDIQAADEAIKEFGKDAASSPRAVHNAIAEATGTDATVLENYINHNIKNMRRFYPMDNDLMSLVAVMTRHAYAVGAWAARRDQGVDDE